MWKRLILNEIYILSLKDKEILKKYMFNRVGVNIILGVAKTDSNGVGKTAMVDAIRMILGEKIANDFQGKEELSKKDIMIVMKVEIDSMYKYLGRQIIDDKNGYISDNIVMDIQCWETYSISEYREKVQDYIFQDMVGKNIPSLQSIREYLVRDEKQGFNDIKLPKRNALKISQCLNFLSLLPTNYEIDINKLKIEQENLEADIKVIKTIAKDIKKLTNDKIKIESEVTKMKSMLDSINISDKIDYDEEKYIQVKRELKKIETSIFKNEFIRKQFEQNIEDLDQKHKKMKELVNLQEYYSQLLKYFPEDLSRNYEEMENFFSYMLENRGDYFKNRIKKLNQEADKLKEEKENLQKIIMISTKIFQNTKIVDDIHNINEQLNEEYEKLANVKIKIDKYNEINNLTKECNKKKGEILEKTMEYEIDYNQYSDIIDNIESHFKKLVQVAYNEVGELSYCYENEVKKISKTGRIKITCQIADENSHGRLYMKINMFDLALFLNRINKNAGCKLLIHDGSYCKPNPIAKANVINYIDEYLKKCNSGQYFVTINKSEIDQKDLNEFKSKDIVIAEFDRDQKDKSRFFGFKY